VELIKLGNIEKINYCVIRLLANNSSNRAKAKVNLILPQDTHLGSLMDKLQDESLKPIVSYIISGNYQYPDSFNNDLQYCTDLGILSVTTSGIKISNKTYSEIIPRVFKTDARSNNCDVIPIAIYQRRQIEDEWYTDLLRLL
jgi:hypothetical protein